MDRRRSRRTARRQRSGARQHNHFSQIIPAHVRPHRSRRFPCHAARYFRTPKSRVRPHLLQLDLRSVVSYLRRPSFLRSSTKSKRPPQLLGVAVSVEMLLWFARLVRQLCNAAGHKHRLAADRIFQHHADHTQRIPACCCATGIVFMLPPPHPTAKAISATANSPLNHFLGFMAFFPFELKYPGGAPRAHRPLPR